MKKAIILAIAAALAGVALTLLLTPRPRPALAPVQSVPKQKDNLQQLNKHYDTLTQPIIAKVSALKEKSLSFESIQSAADKEALNSQILVDQQIEKEGSDTLKHFFDAYQSDLQTADSIKDIRIAVLDSTVIAQDTLLQIERLHSDDLKQLLDTAWRQQEILTANQKTLQKELKKAKRKKTFLNILLFAVTSAATVLLITR